MTESISITWHINDVRSMCPILTKDEAGEVLEYLEHRHDAGIGINWDVIGMAIESVCEEKYNLFESLSPSEREKAEKEFENEYISSRLS